MGNNQDKNHPQEIPTQKNPTEVPPIKDGNKPNENNPANPKSDE